MAASPKRRYHVGFYDIMPATARRELSPFPGSLRGSDFAPLQRVKLVHESPIDDLDPTETLFTVTQAPFDDADGHQLIEVVFDSHMAMRHPDRPRDRFSACCFENVRLADLGAATYPDDSWNQLNYCTTADDTKVA